MPEPRPEILNTPFDAHGGPDGSGKKLLDFSVNSNPFGPPEKLLALLHLVDPATYPDPVAHQAREATARYHSVGITNVIFGNGTAELIHRLAACYLQPERNVVIAAPTFGEYARASALYGAKVIKVDVYTDCTVPHVTPLIEAIQQARPTLVWLCHPNNPTGHAWTTTQLETVAAVCEQADALLVVDVAYLELSEVGNRDLPTGAVSLWSLTKSFCVPGLRVGYALASEEVIRHLERVAAPWQTSSQAQLAATWTRSEGQAFLDKTAPQLFALRQGFQIQLTALGYKVLPSQTNFFLVEVKDAPSFKRHAEEAGFRVRDSSSFGLPKHVRLATQQPDDNARLVAWMRRWQDG